VHGGADHGSGGLTRSARGTSLSQLKGIKKSGVDGIIMKGQADYLGGAESGPGAGGASGAFGTTGYGAGGVGNGNGNGNGTNGTLRGAAGGGIGYGQNGA